MAFTPLGRDILKFMFSGNGRVALANRASNANSLLILAAVIVRHDSAGASSRQVVWDLDLAPGESESFDLSDASDQAFVGIELLLRLFSNERGWREVYLASPPDATPARQWEAGVRLETEPAEEREFFVPESSGLVAYLRATA